MDYLLTQMFLYMLVTFLLGLLLGWAIWRNGATDEGELKTLRDERDALRTNLDSTRTRATKDREAAETLRGEKVELQNRLEACELKCSKLETGAAAPAKPAPVAAAPVAAASSGTGTKPKGLTAARGGKADDLQQISGVGPKLEKLLHSLGYYHFDQIAAWSKSEVAWVDDNLEGFKGRVTRDSWQAQAKKLAK
jgi:predicted flap endonuclease-1-like 5' DNA nuclease